MEPGEFRVEQRDSGVPLEFAVVGGGDPVAQGDGILGVDFRECHYGVKVFLAPGVFGGIVQRRAQKKILSNLLAFLVQELQPDECLLRPVADVLETHLQTGTRRRNRMRLRPPGRLHSRLVRQINRHRKCRHAQHRKNQRTLPFLHRLVLFTIEVAPQLQLPLFYRNWRMTT